MKKRSLALTLAAAAALLAFSTPALAEEDAAAAEKGKPTGKHNFEQWQTIKRLEIRR